MVNQAWASICLELQPGSLVVYTFQTGGGFQHTSKSRLHGLVAKLKVVEPLGAKQYM